MFWPRSLSSSSVTGLSHVSACSRRSATAPRSFAGSRPSPSRATAEAAESRGAREMEEPYCSS
jgi:hypothetical protein